MRPTVLTLSRRWNDQAQNVTDHRTCRFTYDPCPIQAIERFQYQIGGTRKGKDRGSVKRRGEANLQNPRDRKKPAVIAVKRGPSY